MVFQKMGTRLVLGVVAATPAAAQELVEAENLASYS
jgi:hypothetical protein